MTKLVGKITKKVGKILLWILGVFIALDLLLVGLILIPPVQNALIGKLSSTLSEKWGSEISAQKIYLSPTLKLTIKGFVIKDDHDNSMIYVDRAKARLKKITLKPMSLYFRTIVFEEADVALTKYKGEEQINIAKWARNISNPDQKSDFLLKVDHFMMKQSRFVLTNEEKMVHDSTSTEMDFAYLELKDLDFNAIDFTVNRDDISGDITQLAFNQYTGFNLLNGRANFRINGTGLIFNNAVLITDRSILYLDFTFDYPGWKGYSAFTDSVVMNVDIKPSWLDFRDVGCWVNSLRGMDSRIVFGMNLKGTINDMDINDLRVHYKHQTVIKGDLHLSHITDFKNALLEINLNNSKVRFSELTTFSLPKGKRLELPDEVMSIENVALEGEFEGSLKNFTTNWDLVTDLGDIALNLEVSDDNDFIHYKGDVLGSRIDLGRLLKQQPLLGRTSLQAHIHGKAKADDLIASSETNIHGNISRFDFLRYPIHDISFSGSLNNQLCQGEITSADTNVNFMIGGSVDFANTLPIYKLQMVLDRFMPGEITRNLPPMDSTKAKGLDRVIYLAQQNPSLELGFSSLELNMHGKTIYDINGFLGLDNIFYKFDDKQLNGERLRLTVINTPSGSHKYVLTSSFLNADLATNYSFPEILDSLIGIAYQYVGNVLPEREMQVAQTDNENRERYFSLRLETFDIRNLLNIFFPQLRIAPRSMLNVYFSNTNSDSIEIYTSRMRWGEKIRLNNVRVLGKGLTTADLQVKVSSDTVFIAQKKSDLVFSDIRFTTDYVDKQLYYDLSWNNFESVIQGASFLSGSVDFSNKDDILFQFTNSSLNLQGNVWAFNIGHRVHWRKREIEFQDVALKSGKSQLHLNGIFSFDKKDNLDLSIIDINLNQFNRLAENMNLSFDGNISAKIKLGQWREQRMITGKVLIDDFVFNEQPMGNLFLSIAFPGMDKIGFSGGLFNRSEGFSSTIIDRYGIRDYTQETDKLAWLNGSFLFDKKSLEVNADIDTIGIGFLSPFLSSFSHVVKGYAGGKLSFVMNPDSLYFDGVVNVRQGELGIAALNTVYSLTNQNIGFNREGIYFNDVALRDIRGNAASLNGYVNHQRFKDFKINLAIETDRIMAMNIPRQSDVYFYGLGFVSGSVAIIGDTEKLTFRSSNLHTLPGSKLYFPLTFASKVSETEGIVFKVDESVSVNPKYILAEQSKTVMEFDFLFNINKDAEVQIDLDPSIGGRLNARVDGPLHLFYNSQSTMNLNGILTIVSGKFALSLADVLLNVNLDLVPDGKISFNGGIDQSVLDAKAVYMTKTSLKDVITDASTRQVPVNAYLNLQGNLMTPNINFSFELPNGTSEDNVMLNNALNLEDRSNAARQFFALLLTSRFIQGGSFDQMDIDRGMVNDMGGDMLSSIVNNLLFQQIKYVDLGVNIKPGTNGMGEEYSFNALIPLWNDRIIIKTNLGYVDNKSYNSEAHNVLGDVSMEFLMTESGNWRLKAFYTTDNSNNFDLSQTSPWGAAGLGIGYKQDFNDFKDLKASMQRKKKREKIE